MWSVDFFFIFFLINQSLQDCVIDNNTPENAWEHKLQKDLDPKGLRLPCTNASDIIVKLRLVLKSFYLDSDEDTFGIYSWVFLSWHHDELEWNPSDYGGITDTVLDSIYLWTPDLVLLNDTSSRDYDHILNTPCVVKHNGQILCVPRFDDVVKCATVLDNWPYDTQECKIEIGTMNNTKKRVTLDFNERAISMIGAEYGAEWDIMGYKQEENQDSRTQLRMKFVLERHSGDLAAVLVYPSLVLSTLSIISLTLDPRKNLRLLLTCFSLMNHFKFLANLEALIPIRSQNPPTILLYYRGSVIVTIVLVLLTLVLGVMCKKTTAQPKWMCSVNDVVLKSRWRYIVWPRWYFEDAVNTTEEWTNIANIINNLSFFVMIVVYICLYCALMPQPPPVEY